MGLAEPILRVVLKSLKHATVPLRMIQSKRSDALRTLSCCCSYRSGEVDGSRWSSSEEGVRVGKVFHPWETLLDQALAGLAGELTVEEDLLFTFERADHPRWRCSYPYSRLTTASSIKEELSRSWRVKSHGKKKQKTHPHLPSTHSQEALPEAGA